MNLRFAFPDNDDEDEETNEISDDLNHALKHPRFLPAPPQPTTQAPPPKQKFDFDHKCVCQRLNIFYPVIM